MGETAVPGTRRPDPAPRCPDCGADVLVAAPSLRCACGRPLSVDDLPALLREWDRRVAALGALAADARAKGAADIGDVIDRQLRRLETRARDLLRPMP